MLSKKSQPSIVPKKTRKLYERKRFWLTIILTIAAAIWSWGLYNFIISLPTEPASLELRTDAIVALTGGKDRLETSMNLLLAGKAEKLLITGVDNRIKDVYGLDLKWPVEFDPKCCVELGYRAGDTYGNAQEAANWMTQHRYQSLRLVTAAYHMPRSLLEFHQAMPGVEIIPHPVFLNHVRLQEWWLWPGTAFLVLSEYHKYWFARLGHKLIEALFQPNR